MTPHPFRWSGIRDGLSGKKNLSEKVIFGSTLMIRLMERFPILITMGAALIGWVAGETISSDAVFTGLNAELPWLHLVASAAGAAIVLLWGRMYQKQDPAEPGPA